jgi:hypothetical protein
MDKEAIKLLDDAITESGWNWGRRVLVSARSYLARQHEIDADCDVDLATGCCSGCGVDHSGECQACRGHGFHAPGCALIEAA